MPNMAKKVQSRSAIKAWLIEMSNDYSEYFITGKHPAIQFVAHAISWIAWIIIVFAFIGLLSQHHYLIWLTLIVLLSLIESWHNFKLKYGKK